MTESRNTPLTRVSYGVQPENGRAWKHTNAGWPDPTDWIKRLYASLEQRYAVYENEPDVLLRRNKALGMLAEVVSSLHELPPFRNGHAHMPLKDLLLFLQDLDRGRSHAWAKPVNFGGTSVTTSAERELRMWVNAVTHVLWITGIGRTEAYKAVAAGLSSHGRRAKNGGPLPWRTVQQWCVNLGDPMNNRIGRTIMGWWQVLQCPHGYLVTNCETGEWNIGHCSEAKAIAKGFAESIWTMPHLRDRF